MIELLKKDVCEANLELVRKGLVLMTWGNASAIDREHGLVVIKPSGVPYDAMRPEDMAVVNLEGHSVEGRFKPSVDTPSHIVLYKAWPAIGGVVHTHSHYATAWSQACRPIPCFGTTHADHTYGEIPITDPLTEDEVRHYYETNIGRAIVRRYQYLDPIQYPAVLTPKHGPFAWGETLAKAVQNAIALEEIAHMAFDTLMLSPQQAPIEQYLLDKHFLRKHGATAYYGQKNT